MTEREAFEAWWKTINQTIGYVAATAAWQAACAWQRERDAKILEAQDVDPAFKLRLATAIRQEDE